MSTVVDRVLSIVMTACAVAMAGVVAARQFNRTAAATTPAREEPSLVKNWEEILATGMQIGDPKADVQLVEFVDFQCPYCKNFHMNALKPVLKDLKPPVGMVLVHYPLGNHKLARPLAQGAECAMEHGMVKAYADAVFEEPPDTLNAEKWLRLANTIGITNVEQFVDCAEAEDPAIDDRISAGVSLGRRLGIDGTPTVIIGGWLLSVNPDKQEIVRIVRALRTGKDPF